MEAIFSAADSGFNGSLVQGHFVLTNPAAYMGTITGCFLLPVLTKLTMFRVSIPKEHKTKASLVFIGKVLVSSKCFREVTSSSVSGINIEGKHASKIRSRRFSKAVCIKTTPPKV
uniref:Uncharacterized protein n=1 Tax=Panthera tigris altaica TaxID=74533 RepID=A0A8C9J2A3_PANTA